MRRWRRRVLAVDGGAAMQAILKNINGAGIPFTGIAWCTEGVLTKKS